MEATSYAGLSDEELAQLCTEQGPYVTVAFEEIVRRYEPVVLRTCHRYLGDPQEAEEACQDVFLRVFTKIAQFEGRARLRTWLFRIVFNTCSSRQQKLRRRPRHEAIEAVEDPRRITTGEGTARDLVAYSLDQLSATDKEVLLLRFDEGLSLKEIGQVMGLELSAVKMRLYRSMQRFKSIYSGAGGGDRS